MHLDILPLTFSSELIYTIINIYNKTHNGKKFTLEQWNALKGRMLCFSYIQTTLKAALLQWKKF